MLYFPVAVVCVLTKVSQIDRLPYLGLFFIVLPAWVALFLLGLFVYIPVAVVHVVLSVRQVVLSRRHCSLRQLLYESRLSRVVKCLTLIIVVVSIPLTGAPVPGAAAGAAAGAVGGAVGSPSTFRAQRLCARFER